jgi:hypothetical protein
VPDHHPGQCTLRAIQEANASPGVDRGSSSAITTITLSVAGSDDTGAAGDLDVTSMALKGPVTISGAGIDRILDVGPARR